MSGPLPRRSMARRTGAPPGGESYRPDIEGLRAVAVVLVVLFHASILGFAGGFVGVDVFFVISGFLITGLLLREIDRTGTISLRDFYARRVRRLLPASALVLLVTLAASALLLPPLSVPSVAGDVAAAAMYVSNVGFAFQATNYFAASQAPSPVLHYWSLGVEEQFYLFWPAILLLVATLARGRGRRIGLAVVGISIVSFGYSLWLTSTNAPWAFFSLPTRAWELGIGAMLAVAGTRLRLIPGMAATALGWIGLGFVVLSAILFDQSTPFPGTAALLPTVGAGLVIVGGAGSAPLGPGRLLATAVPRFLGRISYSLYLWHWPLLVIPEEAAGAVLPLWERLVLVAVGIVLAAATQRWIEDPFRRGRIVGTQPRRNLAMAGALALVVAIVSVGTGFTVQASMEHPTIATTAAANEQSLDQVLNTLESEAPTSAPATVGATPTRSAAGPTATATTTATSTPTPTPAPPRLPSRPGTKDESVPADLQPSVWNASNDMPLAYQDGCHTQSDGHPSVGTCLYADLGSSTTIALFGDSHALSWMPAVERLAERQGWRFFDVTMSTCSPAAIPIYNPNLQRVSWECNDWRKNAIAQLTAMHPDIILIAGTRGFQTTDNSGNILTGDARTKAWESGINWTINKLKAASSHLIYIADTPLSRQDPATCLSQHTNSILACSTPVNDAINLQWLVNEQSMAAHNGIGFIDPELWVCPSSPCPPVVGSFLVYRDPGHLSATFSSALAGHMLDAIEKQLQPAPTPPPGN